MLEKLVQQLAAQEDRVAAMSAEIARLRKLIFTAKAERFVPALDATASQLQLALDLQAETVAHCKLTSATTVEYVRTTVEVVPATPKAHPGRIKLPDHLRREVIPGLYPCRTLRKAIHPPQIRGSRFFRRQHRVDGCPAWSAAGEMPGG